MSDETRQVANRIGPQLNRRNVIKGAGLVSLGAVTGFGVDSATATTGRPAPEAFYDFEGTGTTVTDRTGNGHTGEIVRATRVSDRGGTVIEFDRNDHTYVRMGQADTLDPRDGSYSLSYWFKTNLDSNTATGDRVELVTKRGDTNERFRTYLYENKVRFSIKDDPGFGKDDVESDKTYNDGQWHHVLAVRDTSASEMRLYIDRELVASGPDNQGDINPTGPLFAGAQPQYPNPHYFTGRIDDIKVWKAAVSPRIEVTIDIKPCSDPNAINADDTGVISVAIKHTEEFNPVDRINVDSLRFGAPDVVKEGGGASPSRGGHVEDVVPCEGDGRDDLVLHFPTEDTGFDGDEDTGRLEGETKDGMPLFGTDSVTLVGW